ncbi:hypothetical protein M885DRAFT_620471, partial [Pelagophyceae sp. CCMP2097]
MPLKRGVGAMPAVLLLLVGAAGFTALPPRRKAAAPGLGFVKVSVDWKAVLPAIKEGVYISVDAMLASTSIFASSNNVSAEAQGAAAYQKGLAQSRVGQLGNAQNAVRRIPETNADFKDGVNRWPAEVKTSITETTAAVVNAAENIVAFPARVSAQAQATAQAAQDTAARVSAFAAAMTRTAENICSAVTGLVDKAQIRTSTEVPAGAWRDRGRPTAKETIGAPVAEAPADTPAPAAAAPAAKAPVDTALPDSRLAAAAPANNAKAFAYPPKQASRSTGPAWLEEPAWLSPASKTAAAAAPAAAAPAAAAPAAAAPASSAKAFAYPPKAASASRSTGPAWATEEPAWISAGNKAKAAAAPAAAATAAATPTAAAQASSAKAFAYPPKPASASRSTGPAWAQEEPAWISAGSKAKAAATPAAAAPAAAAPASSAKAFAYPPKPASASRSTGPAWAQ